jgi:septum formation inhibitor MinC
MDNLKNYRVSLKFSEKDEEQAEVAKLLKQLGRKKSAFITKAVMYYLQNNPSPEIPGNNNVLTKIITENIIKTTILQMIQSGELSYNMQGNIMPAKTETKTKEAVEDDYVEEIIPKTVKKAPKKVVVEEPVVETFEEKQDAQAIDDMLSMLDEF